MKCALLSLLLVFKIVLSYRCPPYSSRRCTRTPSFPSPPLTSLPASANDGPDLDALFDSIKDLDPEDVPEDIQNAIQSKIAENAPADWKIRLNMMGFNPLTIAGYLLAAVIITCNNVFGAGWAGDMLGMNEVIVSDRTQTLQPRINSNGKFSNSYDGIIRTEVQTFELNNKENLL